MHQSHRIDAVPRDESFPPIHRGCSDHSLEEYRTPEVTNLSLELRSPSEEEENNFFFADSKVSFQASFQGT